MWGALLAGGEVIYPTGYGTLETAVIVILGFSMELFIIDAELKHNLNDFRRNQY